MSGKELSKLVAFVKGTQFDLVVRLNFHCCDILDVSPKDLKLYPFSCRIFFRGKDLDVLTWIVLLLGLN